MAKIKLIEAERVFIPNVDFPTDEGTINNRKLKEDEQVRCEIELATIGQKRKYTASYSVVGEGVDSKEETKNFVTFYYDAAVSKNCKKITGLEDYDVKDGETLVKMAKKYTILNDVIQDVFFKINGIHEDDISGGSDGGELTTGE